jgi:hypothetical protein
VTKRGQLKTLAALAQGRGSTRANVTCRRVNYEAILSRAWRKHRTNWPHDSQTDRPTGVRSFKRVPTTKWFLSLESTSPKRGCSRYPTSTTAGPRNRTVLTYRQTDRSPDLLRSRPERCLQTLREALNPQDCAGRILGPVQGAHSRR